MHAPLRLLAFAGLLGSSLLASSDTWAVALPVAWELEIQIGTSPTRIGVEGAGVASVNGSGGLGALSSLEIPAGMIASAMASLDVTDPAASPIEGILLTVANDAGSFQPVVAAISVV